jgi:uncharacterized lipoprotein YmbA
MNKTILIFLAAAISSCTVTRTSTVKTMDIYGAGVIQKPVIVDLDVKETKVTGTATDHSNVSLETVKQRALVDALKKSNADVLVEPKFDTETTGNKITVTVTAFPATYKNFHPIRQEDVELLKAGVVQKAEVMQPPKTERKGGGAIIIAIALLAAITLIGATSGK